MNKLAVAFLLAASSLAANSHEPTLQHTLKGKYAMTTIAKSTFDVSMKQLSVENAAQGDKLGRVSIEKTISGELTATSKGQMLTAGTDVKGSAGYVAIEQITGTLNGRKGIHSSAHSHDESRHASHGYSCGT